MLMAAKKRKKSSEGEEIPVLKWREEQFVTVTGQVLRISLFIHERTGEPILIAETRASNSPNRWSQLPHFVK